MALFIAGCTSSSAGLGENTTVEVLETRGGYERVFLHEVRDGEVRDILVEVHYPTTGGLHPTLLIGGYRSNDRPVVIDQVDGWNLTLEGAIVVRIGFPHMNVATGDIQFRDVGSQADDVHTVLQWLRGRAGTFGETNGNRVWFGISMGGVTGLVSAMRPDATERYDALVAVGAFLPQKEQGFVTPEWELDQAPETLLIASMTDETVPYALSRDTYERLSAAGREVSMLTRQDADHAKIDDCAALSWAVRSWIEAKLGVGGDEQLSAGSCATPGPQPGGTSGLGLGALATG